jgi:hypothetical protein
VKQSDQGESGETIEPDESFRRFVVGDRVCLLQSVPYLKTADPMPMLRPPDLVATGEVGAVSEIRPLDQLAVRFRRGTFLLSVRDLRPASGSE